MEPTKEKPNYYLLLELPYDPPEVDPHEISEAIKRAKKKWNKLANHPIKSKQVSIYRSMLPDIERVMLQDPNARAQEAKEAKQRVQQSTKAQQVERNERLTKALGVLLSKGSINETEITHLMTKMGVTRAEVEQALPAGTKVEGLIETYTLEDEQLFAKEKEKKVLSHLNQLNVRPTRGDIPTLYDFLNVSEESSSTAILKIRSDMTKDLQLRPLSTEVDIKKDLCGFIKEIFSNDEERQKYDNSLQHKRFKPIEEIIDITGELGGITLEQYEMFVASCVEKGINKTKAQSLIKSYCHEKNYLLHLVQANTEQKQNLLACPQCGKFNEAEDTSCHGCGMPLIKTCIKCHTVSNISKENCSSCGLSFDEMLKYESFIQQCKEAIVEKNIDHAAHAIRRASLIEPTDEAIRLQQQVEKLQQKVVQFREDISNAITQRYYYKAQHLLQNASNITLFTGELQQMHLQVMHQIQSTNDRLTSLEQLPEEQRLAALLDTLKMCADSDWALSMLEKYPPTVPTNFYARVVNDTITLDWHSPEAQGAVTYKVYRHEGAAPQPQQLGQLVTETTSLTFTDYHALPNKQYWYSIVAFRKNIQSKEVVTYGPIAKFSEAEFYSLEHANNSVKIRWNPAPNTLSIIVRNEHAPSTSVNDGTVIYKGTNGEFLDVEAEKGKRYFYTIFSTTDVNGQIVTSYGVTKELNLIALTAINEATVTKSGDYFVLTYALQEALQGDIRIFTNQTPFTETPGTLADYKSLQGKYALVPFEVIDQHTLQLPSYIDHQFLMIVTTNEDECMVGQSLFAKELPSITQVVLVATSQDMKLNWQWPREVETVELKIVAANESFAQAAPFYVSKADYEAFDGYKISANTNQSIAVQIRAVFHEPLTKQLVFSSVHEELLTIGQKVLIRYEIEKKGLFSKKYKLKISLDEQVKLLPNIAVVCKKGGLPLNIDEGTVVHRINSQSSNALEVDLTQFYTKGVETYFRLFFENTYQAASYELKPIGATKI